METASGLNALRYRLFQAEDLPGLLRLWEQESNWGAPTVEQWRQWYVDLPYDPAIIAVAVDEDDEIAGQIALIPTRASAAGKEFGAVRGSAAILRKDFRHSSRTPASGPEPAAESTTRTYSIEDPAVRLFSVGMEEAFRRNYALFYSLPFHRLIPKELRPEAGFRTVDGREMLEGFAEQQPFGAHDGRYFVAEYRCLERALSSLEPEPAPETPLTVEVATDFQGEFDDLWAEAVRTYPIGCGIIRRSGWLRYKNGGHLVLACRNREGVLSGYAAINRTSALLVDFLTRDPSLTMPVLRSVMHWLARSQRAGTDRAPDRLKVMETPWLASALHELAFAPVDFSFLLMCGTLEPSLPLETVAPPNWYLMPGD